MNTLGAPGNPYLANPQEWFIAAYAYLQLAGENPMWFRDSVTQRRVSDIISPGQNITNFCRSLTLSPGTTSINWNLWNALEKYYFTNLTNFNSQVSATETVFANAHNFNLGFWRKWGAAAPRVTATATGVLSSGGASGGAEGSVVAIAAGGDNYSGAFSLALMADGTVGGWGGDDGNGQTDTYGLANVVAIAAGGNFGLALKDDGTVVGWGSDSYGEATGTPSTVSPYTSSGPVTLSGQPLTDVVAIAAGYDFSLALRADGTVVGWGDNTDGETTIPAGLANVVAIAAGRSGGLFLTPYTGGSAASGGLSFVRAQIPDRVGYLFYSCNTNTISELAVTDTEGSVLDKAAASLNGAKALLSAVLQLGMPYTLERDGVLHGFLYGSQSLMDSDAATTFLQNQNALLQATPNAAPQALEEVAPLAYLGFQNRLNLCLTNLQATGQPEIPRLVGQTLRLLNLLSHTWTPPANSPPPVLEISRQTNAPSLLLYGEPYVNYTLQYQDSLGAPGWTTTPLTNLQDGQTIIPPLSGSAQHFYRLMLPTP